MIQCLVMPKFKNLKYKRSCTKISNRPKKMVIKRELDCFIQARITSKRFSKKVLKKIKKNTILEIIFKRLSLSKSIRKIVFLIPKNKKNLPLLKYLIKKIINILWL